MAIHIVVDGYNLIRQSGAFRSAERIGGLESGREALLRSLSQYRTVKSHAITVVFDGGLGPANAKHRERRAGVDIVFSRVGESADCVIKKMAVEQRERLVVVTSDRELALFAAKCGASTIDSVHFEQRMAMALTLDAIYDTDHMGNMSERFVEPESDGWTPTTQKKGPSRRLSKRARKTQAKANRL